MEFDKPRSLNLESTLLYQMHGLSKGRAREHVGRWAYPGQPVYVGHDAVVIDTLSVWKGRQLYCRYYGFLDRWLSVFVTFDSVDLSLTSNPEDDFPFAFNCDMTTPHYMGGDAIYTTDLLLDVLVHADGRAHRLVDVDEFETAFARGAFGRVWYEGARREAGRVAQEAESGRFISMLQDVASFPDVAMATGQSTLTELGLNEVDFKYHPTYPRYQ